MTSKWCIVAVALVTIVATFARADRREMTILRLPNDTITIDGRDDDWRRIPGDALARCGGVSNDVKLWTPLNPDRGEYSGPDDCSVKAQLAVDDANLYVLADVRDQFLINTATPDEAYWGDDFEVFVEAGPPEARFGGAKSENYRQFIFVPALANADFPPGVFLWQADRNAGVVAASRVRPWGYTIEIKIPKAIFPHWQKHPEMDSVGFDLLISDADAPGVDCRQPATKGSLCLAGVGEHFRSPENIGLAKIEAAAMTLAPVVLSPTTSVSATTDPVAIAPATTQASPATAPLSTTTTTTTTESVAATPPSTVPSASDEFVDQIRGALPESADAVAQDLLDRSGDGLAPPAAVIEALKSPHLPVRKAAAFVLAQQWQVDAPVEMLRGVVNESLATTRPADLDLRRYALVALARCHKLPTDDVLFAAYVNPTVDPATRLTYVWCAGINGDKTLVPKLISLLADPNLRVRMMAAMSLGTLRDPAANAALKTMAEKDPHQYAQIQAKIALDRIAAK